MTTTCNHCQASAEFVDDIVHLRDCKLSDAYKLAEARAQLQQLEQENKDLRYYNTVLIETAGLSQDQRNAELSDRVAQLEQEKATLETELDRHASALAEYKTSDLTLRSMVHAEVNRRHFAEAALAETREALQQLLKSAKELRGNLGTMPHAGNRDELRAMLTMADAAIQKAETLTRVHPPDDPHCLVPQS